MCEQERASGKVVVFSCQRCAESEMVKKLKVIFPESCFIFGMKKWWNTHWISADVCWFFGRPATCIIGGV